jgi:PTH1 family peptidyl-tRNA hydrolase
VAHDELDFPAGTVRMKQGGGAAGHNGLKDISARLGTQDYWRLRIGIGHPGDRNEVTSYVLSRPAQEDRAAIDTAIGGALEILPLVLAGDLQGAMMKLHSQPVAEPVVRPEKMEKPKKAPSEPAAAPKVSKKAAVAEPKPVKGEVATKAAQQAESSSKPTGLGSFFKKILPGSGQTPKK